MTNILGITGPIFLLIALGFAGARAGILKRQAVDGLGAFIFYFAMPALVMRSLAGTDFGMALEPLFMVAYGVAALLSIVLVWSIARYGLRRGVSESGYFALGGSLSNTIIVGYPLLQQLDLPDPVRIFTMALMVESFIILPAATLAIESGQSGGGKGIQLIRQILVRTLSNPIIIAIVAGIVLSLLSLSLPPLVDRSLELLGAATTGACLIFIGGVLGTSRVASTYSDIGLVATAKLVVLPLLVAGLVKVLPDFDPVLQKAVILIGALPMLTIYPLLGTRYGFAQLGAGALVVTTALSFITLSLVVYLLF